MLELAHRQRFRLRDKTLGVVGVGNVGSRVVRYARALGMRVLQNDPPLGLHERALEADIVTVHVPLLETTRHMFHRDNLEGFIFINTSRGAVVDNPALLKAIDGDRLGGVVLDVWENEPHISPELLDAYLREPPSGDLRPPLPATVGGLLRNCLRREPSERPDRKSVV